ncbi:hypothetical protein AAF712_009333 [Marasmius tenuissimus]|uniref:WD40 repeat-like protein n=1 Tax=Marasmius tenuissimus TaxID=585030 RepID=A0ABR2ZQB4_9AGAR
MAAASPDPQTVSLPPRFERFRSYQGAQNAVLSVRFSPDGKFISAAGYNGVNVWQVDTGSSVELPRRGSSPTKAKYIYPTSGWIYYEDYRHYILLLGSLEGDVVAWDWNKRRSAFELTRDALPTTSSQQVTSIDILQPSSHQKARAVVSHYDRSISVWKIPLNGEYSLIFMVDLEFIPRTIAFDPATKYVYAFSMHGGNLGFAALHHANELVVASTGKDFQILQLRDYLPLLTLQSRPATVLFPMQAAFLGDGIHLVVGTDSGLAIVYNATTGKPVRSLRYPKGGLVQTVAVG